MHEYVTGVKEPAKSFASIWRQADDMQLPRRRYCGSANAMLRQAPVRRRDLTAASSGGAAGAVPGAAKMAGNVPFACATGSTTNCRPFT